MTKSSLLNANTNEAFITEAAPSKTVVAGTETVKRTICEMVTTFERVSLPDVSRILRKTDANLTNYIDLAVDELRAQGIITIDESNVSVTHYVAGGKAWEKIGRSPRAAVHLSGKSNSISY